MAKTEKKTPRDLIRHVMRRRNLFLLGASLCAIVVLLAMTKAPLKYSATTLFQREIMAPVGDRSAAEEFERDRVNLQIELVGREAVDRVIGTLGMTKGKDFSRTADGQFTVTGERNRQQLLASVMKALRAQSLAPGARQQIDLMAVTFTWDDPTLAAEVPNLLVKNYIEKTRQAKEKSLKDTLTYQKARLDSLDIELNSARKNRTDYESANAGSMPDNPNGLAERVRREQSDMDALKRQRDMAEQKVKRIKALIPAGASPQATLEEQRLGQELDTLMTEIEAIRGRGVTEKHPGMIVLRQREAELRRRLASVSQPAVTSQPDPTSQPASQPDSASQSASQPDSQPSTSPATALQGPVAVELAIAEEELATYTRDFVALEKQWNADISLLQNYAPIRQGYLRLVKQQQDLEVSYALEAKRLEEVSTNLQNEQAEQRTVLKQTFAEKPSQPSSPSLLMALGAAGGGGLLFGALLVFLANAWDRSVVTTDDAVRYFKTNIYGVIGEIVSARQQRRQRLRRWVVGPIISLVVLVAMAAAGLNIYIWLQKPEEHPKWQRNPVAYVAEKVSDPILKLFKRL